MNNDEVKRIASRRPPVERLSLRGETGITEVWPLAKCDHLKYLDISYTGVEHCPITLIHCNSLRYLDVSGTKVHTATLAAIIEKTEVTLDTLRRDNCDNVDEDLLKKLVRTGFRQTIDNMLEYAEVLMNAGITRGHVNLDILNEYKKNDWGPFWTRDDVPPKMDMIKRGGCVYTGFINLLLRRVNIPLLHQIQPIDAPRNLDLDFGLGKCDEWLYVWKDKVEPFDEYDRSYETGTLLLRTWNTSDHGHVAMIIDDAGELPMRRTIADTQKKTLAKCILKMRQDTDFSEPPFQPPWDTKGDFTVHFGANHNGFTHVLRPQHWAFSRLRVDIKL